MLHFITMVKRWIYSHITGVILKIKGFTLLETLGAVTILTFVIIGPLSVIISSSSYSKQTKDNVIAAHLADEALDLVQNRYDSWYIYCKNYVDASIQECLTLTGETSSQVAWRLFKESFKLKDGQPSCFNTDNVYGCSFDHLDMITSVTTTPIRHITNGSSCQNVVMIATSTIIGGQTSSYKTYVCSGIPSHTGAGPTLGTMFSRSVTLQHIPSSFEGGNMEDQQFDDILVVVKIMFKGTNGTTKSSTSTRFLHARP